MIGQPPVVGDMWIKWYIINTCIAVNTQSSPNCTKPLYSPIPSKRGTMASLGCKSLEYEQYTLLSITFKSLPNDIPCMRVFVWRVSKCAGLSSCTAGSGLIAWQTCPVWWLLECYISANSWGEPWDVINMCCCVEQLPAKQRWPHNLLGLLLNKGDHTINQA